LKIKAGIQGERGSFSEQAAEKLAGPDVTPVCCASFEDLFAAVRDRRAQVAIVPIENTLAGSIHRNYDLLLESGLQITAETRLRIEHCLIGMPGSSLSKIRTVLSHPVALDQCRQFFRDHPGVAAIEVYDTAGAVQKVLSAGDSSVAAIAGAAAARHFGGRILATNVEDNAENFTRFFALEPSGRRRIPALRGAAGGAEEGATARRRRPAGALRSNSGSKPADAAGDKSGGNIKTSLVFSTKNEPGALFRCLSVFALRDINLSKIESRPLHGKPWQYLFYVDLLAGADEERSQNALRHLEEVTDFFKVLGSYRSW
jgi:prephenate dehydratase